MGKIENVIKILHEDGCCVTAELIQKVVDENKKLKHQVEVAAYVLEDVEGNTRDKLIKHKVVCALEMMGIREEEVE